MKIAFNPSNSSKNILDLIKNNKDIIFDLKGHSIYARGVEFKGTDTNTWRPVVDNLTSNSATSSLSANQGRVLAGLINGKSDSDHNHDGRYLKLTGGTLTGNLIGTSAMFSGRFYGNKDDEGIIIKPSSNGYAGLILGSHDGERSIFYFVKNKPFWRYSHGSDNLDIIHPKKSGTIALISDIPSSLKNPHSLTLKANGTTLATYDGSSAKEANFTYANVGAASASHTHSYYAVNENYGGFKKAERLPTSGFYQSYISDKEESGGNAPWKSWMHLINCQHSAGNNYALQIAASFFNNNIFKIRVTNNSVNTAWRDIIHSGNIGSQSVNYANSAGNSDKVDGYHATSSNKPWGTIPVITTSGWMDIGKHLEFHFDNTTGSDYSTILRCTGNYSNIVNLPSVAGTLALISDIPSSVKNPNAIKFKDINGNVVTYDGSVAKDLTAGTYMAKLPYGFSSFASGVSWGNTTGTSFASWNDSTGGSIDFRRDNPSSGKMSIKVDGRVYVNEGRNPVLSAESNSGFWGMRTPDGGNDWIRTPNNGLIPYVPGGAGGGHSSLGTSGWYFSTAYIDKIYGSLKGNADTASSANKLTTARNIALGTDLRGSANFDGSSNITINANINACTIGVGSTNGLPFKRIAHFETGSSYNDNALLLYISQGYMNGSNGICRVEFRTDNISSSNSNPSASSSVRWLVRNGYGLDSLYAGYYVTTGKAYIDIYLKTTGGYQGTVIRVLQDSRGGINSDVQLISSYYYSDTNHKEAYSSIEAASTALYNRAYTRIVSGRDVGTVSYSNSTGSVHWNNVTNKPSSFTPSSHTHTWTSITDKIVVRNEFNVVNAGYNNVFWFNYLPINDRNNKATISTYCMGNGQQGYASVTASGFIKNGGNENQLLRADGGIAAFNWSGQSGQPTWLWGGNNFNSYYVYNPSNFRVAYAASAGNAETLGGEHASSFVRAGHYESQDLNKLDTYSFIRSVSSNNKDTSPNGNTGWYNVIQAVHRNGVADGPNYIGQIALGMTTNINGMFYRTKYKGSWYAWNEVVTTNTGLLRYSRNNVNISSPNCSPIPPSLLEWTVGYPRLYDPEFNEGYNNVQVYNNASNGVVTVTRVHDTNVGNSSSYIMKVVSAAGAIPNYGGWHVATQTELGKVYTCLFRASIPSGVEIEWNSNSIGTGGQMSWLTNNRGTGKWAWYAVQVYCGSGGSTTFYFSAKSPCTWYLSYVNVIENNRASYAGLRSVYSDYLKANASIVFGRNELQYFNQYTGVTSGATNNANPKTGWYHILRMNHANNNGYFVDLAIPFHDNRIQFRRITSGSDNGWRRVITEEPNHDVILREASTDGNVGIGINNPAYKLDVNGQMRAEGFHHSSVNSDNYMLLAGGGYKSFGGDNSNPIFLGYLDLYHGDDGTISSSFLCLGYSVPFTYTRGGNYCRIYIPDTTHQVFYIGAATASVHYSGGGMDTWTDVHRGSGAWWLHCYAEGTNEVRVKGFCQNNDNNDSWWGGNPLWSGNNGANKITVCIFGYVEFR